ncbi:response regulator [Dyella sp. 20L07]|uniref:response regulator n=1 Tax=Dyella sp. 20L07 TaxID=3384240 RepID=UPI003D2DE9C4
MPSLPIKEFPVDFAEEPKRRSCRVIVADAYPVVLDGLKALLERDKSLNVVELETDPLALLNTLAKAEFDILVTDLNLQDEQGPVGLRLLRQIRRQWPDLSIVVYTVMENAIVLRSALSMGAQSLVLKSDQLAALLAAVKAAIRKDRYIGASAARLLGDIHAHPPAVLSRREFDVLTQLHAGISAADLAGMFRTSIKTISAQKRSAMVKLGLESDFDISIYLHENGLPKFVGQPAD